MQLNFQLWILGTGLRLTALLRALVVADQRLLVGRAEQPGPVDGVVVAELAVLRDVHVPGTDLPQRLELQRGDALLLQHQQGDSTKTEREKRTRLEVRGGGGGECRELDANQGFLFMELFSFILWVILFFLVS